MSRVLKNVPPINFGIAGNRGNKFPLNGICADVTQPFIPIDEIDCWLVKEEDGFTNIFTEINFLIGVDCTQPIDLPCFLVLEEDPDTDLYLAELEDDFSIFCDAAPEPDIPFIVLEQDIEEAVLFNPYGQKFNV